MGIVLALTDATWLQIVQLIVGAVTAIATGWIGLRQSQIKKDTEKQAEDVKTAVEETNIKTDRKFNAMSSKIEEVHKTVNGTKTELVDAVREVGEANVKAAVKEGVQAAAEAFKAGVQSEIAKKDKEGY